MLRALVALLLLANLLWLAWSQGALRGVGLAPLQSAEPQRLAHQLRPDALRVAPLSEDAARGGAAQAPVERSSTAALAEALPAPAEAQPVPSAAAEPPAGVCLQSEVLDASQIQTVRAAAQALPDGVWQIDEVQLPGSWMVYMGRLDGVAAVAAKRGQLRALGIDATRAGPGFEPGLSLGRYPSAEAAGRALAAFNRRGVRTARVVQERRAAPGFVLRLPAADEALQPALRALGPALAGKEMRPCASG